MPIFQSQLLPGSRGDHADADQPVNITHVTNEQWNAAMVDENAVEIDLDAATVAGMVDAAIPSGATSFYEEGDFTPALTFATPGDLSVTYDTQFGRFTRIGRVVIADFAIDTATFTHSTASGQLRLTGLPYTTGVTNTGQSGAIHMSGWTLTGVNDIAIVPQAGQTYAIVVASRTGTTTIALQTTHVGTGVEVILKGTIVYVTQ